MVENFIYDPNEDRKSFYVTPPQPAAPHQVEMVVSKIPVEIAAGATPIEIDDVYQPALVSYMLYKANLKDIPTEMRKEAEARATAYYRQFLLELGIETEG